jgi:hypothetical protein
VDEVIKAAPLNAIPDLISDRADGAAVRRDKSIEPQMILRIARKIDI